jgi:hypothetical protein
MPERGPPVVAARQRTRRLRGLITLAVVLALLFFAGDNPSAGAATVAQQLGSLPTIQPFNGETTSRSQFESRWSPSHWVGVSGKGRDTARGWNSSDAYPNVDSAYYNAASFTAATGGVAAAVTLTEADQAGLRYFSLWLDASEEPRGGLRSGYELRFTFTAEETYTVELIKWLPGLGGTALRTLRNVTFRERNTFAIVDQGSTVSAWTNTGTGFTQLLSASDTALDYGSVVLSSNSQLTFMTTFKAGQLTPAVPTLTRMNPASPSDNPAPFVVGTAVTGTTVKLYTNATCTGSPLATGTAAALASPGLQVTVAEYSTTSFYATASDTLGNTSECSSAITYVEDPTIGIAEGLARLTQLDAFGTVESPLSNGGRWSKLNWASNTGQVAGSGTSGGWAPANGYPVVFGAYWNPTTFADAGRGVAVGGTLSVGAELPSRWFSLWLDASEPGSAQSGYELRFTYVGAEEEEDLYNVTLTKWVSGTRTVLATARNYTFAPQSSFALVCKGGTVYVWTNTGTGYGLLLRASDTAFSRGYAGIEGAGNITRVRSFRAGTL